MKMFGAVLIAASLGFLSIPGAYAQVSPPPAPSPGSWSNWSSVKDGIKTLLQAKVGDAVIIAYINHNAADLHPTTQDLVDLKQAGASEAVLMSLVGATAKRYPPPPAAYPDNSYATTYPDSSSTYVYTSPDYAYDYSPYYYYPYWYPYWGLGFGFSFPFFFHNHHHFDHFHDGHFVHHDGFHDGFHGSHFGGTVIAPHTFSGHGGMPHGGVIMHGGGGGGGHFGGGGGHR